MIILVLLAIALLWWWLYTPTIRFIREFASLVDVPEIRSGVPTLIFARPTVTGRFNDRPVELQMVPPAKHRVGHVLLSMKTTAPDGAPWKDSLLTTSDGDVSRATFDLEARYELILSLADGWLRAKWTPSRLRFPGRFDPDRWRKTLAHMHALAGWMEKRDRR